MEINRRQFMIGAGALMAAGCQSGDLVLAPAHGGTGVAAAQPAPPADSTVDLIAQWVETELDGTRVRLRSYNGQVPGPTLEVHPGETVAINLRNELTPYDSSGWDGNHNVPHMLNHTNLHVHGMEVMPHLFEPQGTSEPLSQMISVGPGEAKEYRFQVPDDHPSGLFWYHPHHHGSTAVQAVSGMAGALIVRGPIDEVPEIKAAREIVVAMNDIGLFPSEEDPDVWVYEPVQNAIWNTLGSEVQRWNADIKAMEPAPDLQGGFSTGDYKLRYYLVNGQPYFKEVHNDEPTPKDFKPPADCPDQFSNQQDPVSTQLTPPRFTLRPGEVVRFRMLNANSDNLMPIVVEGHQLHLLALDGVNFPAPRTLVEKPIDGRFGDQQLLLAPANRAEFLLQGGAPGVYKIVQLHQCEQFLVSRSKVIAEIEIAGDPMDPPMALPATLPPPTRHYPLIDASEVVRLRNIVFSMAFPGTLNPIVGLDFMVNNNVYQEEAVPIVVGRETVEEWHLRVPDGMHGGSEGHPFHIHVNSFEVISIDGQAQPPGTIQDTIWVGANSEVVIRTRFREWLGKAVFHCHILPHEDCGMMQNFLITDGHHAS